MGEQSADAADEVGDALAKCEAGDSAVSLILEAFLITVATLDCGTSREQLMADERSPNSFLLCISSFVSKDKLFLARLTLPTPSPRSKVCFGVILDRN